jgi:hypothetical protein
LIIILLGNSIPIGVAIWGGITCAQYPDEDDFTKWSDMHHRGYAAALTGSLISFGPLIVSAFLGCGLVSAWVDLGRSRAVVDHS